MSASEDLAKDKFFSMLESASKVKFFLLIASFLLLFDSMMVHFSSAGIVGIQKVELKTDFALGIKLLVAFVCFSGLISLVFTLLYPLTVSVYETAIEILKNLEAKLVRGLVSSRPEQFQVRWTRRTDCVRPWEIREEAHETQSEFLIGIYDRYQQERAAQDAELYRIQLYAFSALVLASLNFYWSGIGDAISIVGWVEEQWSSTPVWLGLSVFFVLMVAPLHRNASDSEWIYCPILHRRLEKESKDEYDRAQAFSEKMRREAQIHRATREAQQAPKERT